MSSPSGEEIPEGFVSQESRELTLIRRFDFWTLQNGPQRGAVVLRIVGFGIASLIGLNPDQARVGDIAVEVSHSGFYTSARIWLRVTDGTRGWVWISELQDSFFFTTYLA
ncbi:unnamed protein product [Sphagnum troendelagicum]